MVLEEATCFS